MKRLFLTGAAGFIGSHVLAHVMENTDWEVIAPVSFRHKGDSLRFQDDSWDAKRINIFYHDLAGPLSERLIERLGPIDIIWNLAADSHVDRSIIDPVPFVLNNVNVILTMLEFARAVKPQAFFQISTDEVYGPAPEGVAHKEWAPIIPSNPYSASKAMQEDVAIAYWRTYGVPVVITNTMNNIGERQDPEKFLPLIISKTAKGEVVPVHGQPGKIGSRFYLHARNHADALLFLTRYFTERTEENAMDALIGVPLFPEVDRPVRFNVVGDREVDNLTLAQMVAEHMGKSLLVELIDFHKTRSGHDPRYALDGWKLASLGWQAPVSFETSLKRTIDWTLAHPEWLK